ncbi:putative ATPase [Saccharothrix carnea]|uniref:Putative ATPase n=1 Tax=Saccharothrix carnea TaxID=1280637 RepID=A0A2P8HZS5_SACCR|nr:tetratricopeptide repeat protein [Saccharothrix carnea]PSL51732.1 putative ATPase [Saccharothrix carnea]
MGDQYPPPAADHGGAATVDQVGIASGASTVVQAGRDAKVEVNYGITRPQPKALAGLPPAEAAFTGRSTDLAVLADVLRPGADDQPTVATIAGPPGIGKTTLALQAAHDAVDAGWFPGGVLYQDLRGFARQGRVEPEAALATQLRKLGVGGEHIPPDLDGRSALYRSLLAERADRVLVVLDNAEQAGQVAPLLPGDRRHRVLVTSRNTLDLSSARHHTLGVLTGEEAVELLSLLLTSAHPGDDRIARAGDAALRLAELCGFLPHAVAIAGGLLVGDRDQPVAELVDVLADRTERLTELATRERSFRAAVDLSYERLDPPDARVFRLLAANPGPTTTAATAAALADLDERSARRSLDLLRRAHLIEPAGPRGRFRFHDLIRLYAEDRLRREEPDEPRDAALRRLLAHFHRLMAAVWVHELPTRLVEGKQLALTGTFESRADALAWFDAERPNLVAVVNRAFRSGHHAGVCLAAIVLGYSLQRWGDWDEALTVHRLAVEAARQVVDPAAEGRALLGLGTAYRTTRDFERADAVLRQALDVLGRTGDRAAVLAASRELEGSRLSAHFFTPFTEPADDEPDVPENAPEPSPGTDVLAAVAAMETTSNTAMKLFVQGRFDEARAASEELLAGCRQIGSREGERVALNNIGDCHYHLRRLDQAITSYTASIEAAREVGNRHGEAQTSNSLGNAYQSHGRPDLAVAHYDRAAELFRALRDRYGEAMTLSNLGAALVAQDERERARDCLLRAVELLDGQQRPQDAARARALLDALGS